VPRASEPVGTTLTFRDTLVRWKARWGIGRMRLTVSPGLYAVNEPGPGSPVLVTANYRITFDLLRGELSGIAAWILVLDTKGINVWCAAGKGTFGTTELIRRIETTGLAKVVEHRTIILPQLGAPGVAAHDVRRGSGFRLVYGPVLASDIPAFLAAGMKATPAMRRVGFPLGDRLALVPMELVPAAKWLPPLVLLPILLQLLSGGSIAWGTVIPWIGALVAGAVAVPALLPWIPGRSFAWKGWLTGVVWTLTAAWVIAAGPAELFTNLLILPALTAYLALNFTGATPYTSPSGVAKELRFALPLMIASASLGLVVGFGAALL
jgi:hypothetical protein